MNKVIVAGIVILAFLGITLIFSIKNKPPINTPIAKSFGTVNQKDKTTNNSVFVVSNKLKTYKDPVGFVFSYPDNFIFTRHTIDDTNVYSELELTVPNSAAKVLINLRKSDIKSLDDITSMRNGPERQIENTKIADLKAQQTTAPTNIDTYALDDGVLISINTFTSNQVDTMTAVHQSIVNSFHFEAPENMQQSVENQSISDTTGVEYEGEETIQ